MNFRTIFNGTLGALTFGVYSQVQTNKAIELHNQKLEKMVLEHIKIQYALLINK